MQAVLLFGQSHNSPHESHASSGLIHILLSWIPLEVNYVLLEQLETGALSNQGNTVGKCKALQESDVSLDGRHAESNHRQARW